MSALTHLDEAKGMVERNRDATADEVRRFCAQVLFINFGTPLEEGAPPTKRRASLLFASLASSFRAQLAALQRTLDASAPHFIRAVTPNHNRAAFQIDPTALLAQLKNSGILAAAPVMRGSFPFRLPFASFLRRYAIANEKMRRINKSKFEDARINVALAQNLLRFASLREDSYAIGRTKVRPLSILTLTLTGVSFPRLPRQV